MKMLCKANAEPAGLVFGRKNWEMGFCLHLVVSPPLLHRCFWAGEGSLEKVRSAEGGQSLWMPGAAVTVPGAQKTRKLVIPLGSFRDGLWLKPHWGLGSSKAEVQKGEVSKETQVSEECRPVIKPQQTLRTGAMNQPRIDPDHPGPAPAPHSSLLHPP